MLLRRSLRSLRKSWPFAATAALTLAIGTGVNATLFSLADAIVFRPFPFVDQERLVIGGELVAGGENLSPARAEVSHANFADWRSRSRAFDGLAAMGSSNWAAALETGSGAVAVQQRAVSGNFFEVLGIEAAAGRTLADTDDRTGAVPVAVISHGLWQRQFGGAGETVGRSIVIDGTPFTIAGILPRGFAYPPAADVWMPLLPQLARIKGPGLPDFVTNRGAAVLHVVGRMKPGVVLDAAREDLDRVIRDLAAEHGRRDRVGARLTLLVDDLLGPARVRLLSLLTGVLLLLLVAAANVAGLMLMQASRRRVEFAVHLSLGASRGTLVRQLLVESVVIVAVASAAALLLARATLPAVLALVPQDIPRVDEAAVDARVALWTAALGLATAILCWIGPALSLGDVRLESALRGGSRSVASGPGRRSRLLVGFEVAIAVVILTCAGLLYRSVDRLGQVDLGFEAGHVIAADVQPPPGMSGAPDAEVERFYERLLEGVRTLPFVMSAAAAGARPLAGPIGLDSSWTVEGQSRDEADQNPFVNTVTMTPEYFETLRIPLVEGRGLTAFDDEESEPVVVVSGTVARRAWPGQSAVGKRIRVAALRAARGPDAWWTVVGVAGDVRYRHIRAATLDVYVATRQSNFSTGHVVIRTALPPGRVAAAVRERLRQVNPDGVVAMSVLDDDVAAQQAPWRTNFLFFTFFAAFTALLAVIGLYALLASAVVDRYRELGIRMALGATRRRVMRDVLLDGLALASGAAGIGAAAAAAGSQALRSLLFEVSPLDAMTLALAPALLVAVAAAACALPAFRATRVDPVASLRAE